MLSRTLATVSRRVATSAIRPSTVIHRQLAPGTVAATRSYHQNVLDHYTSPRNHGSLPKTDADVGTGLVGAPACGDVMKLQIRVDSEGKITEAKFKTFGCGSAIASSSYMTTLINGMTLDEAAKVKNTTIAQELCLPPVKLHCSMLAEDAIKSAISNYYEKNPHAKPTNLAGREAKLPVADAQAATAAA